ncbi:MAG: hypothetical protein Satyrvirus15_19 [Satyrvirus sp.]|uniref:TIR domain-containing protein n=1 Tax=Satyrvirus sp. TaxID=2487771 RepID=A0A3G5AE05_9VIRU|nr:MAG: hypothetical protein Satyrvirus15_19 [Satyrvirus sp.]
MHRIFISYKFSNVSEQVLNEGVVILVEKLKEMGYDVFCNFERNDFYIKENWSANQIMNDCFKEIKKSDFLIMFVAPNTVLGEGMLIELGYATHLSIPTLLILPSEYKSISARAVSTYVLEYLSLSQLFSPYIIDVALRPFASLMMISKTKKLRDMCRYGIRLNGECD